jgi:hypothetical protein
MKYINYKNDSSELMTVHTRELKIITSVYLETSKLSICHQNQGYWIE